MSTLKNKAGEVVGFFGLDQLTENGVNYTMIVMANESQGIKGISMVTDTQGNKSGAFDATMVSTSASELQAVIMQANNSQDIINLLMDRLQPYILSLKK